MLTNQTNIIYLSLSTKQHCFRYSARPTKPGSTPRQAGATATAVQAQGGARASANAATSTTTAAAQPAPPSVPPGMSEYGFKRVLSEGEMKAEDLEQVN